MWTSGFNNRLADTLPSLKITIIEATHTTTTNMVAFQTPDVMHLK